MMKFLVLDDFPLWTTYLLGLVVLCGFLFALTMLLRSLWINKSRARAARPGRQAWFFAIVGALAVWFLGSSMYLRFHAVGIGPREIELIFFWPRPPVSIGADAPAVIWKSRPGKNSFAASTSKNAKALKRFSKKLHHGFTPTLRIVAPNGRREARTANEYEAMVDTLKNLLIELKQFGRGNDNATAERPSKMLNITLDTGEFLAARSMT